MKKSDIVLILQELSDSQDGQLNLDSRLAQELIADKLLETYGQR